jgi:hypothetical protein
LFREGLRLDSFRLSFRCVAFSSGRFPINLFSTNPSDEGMTNWPSIFAYLVFRPRRDIVEGISEPMNMTAWRGPGTQLGVQDRDSKTETLSK